MAQRHFFDWDEIKRDEEKVIRAPHFGFRAITAVLFLMAFYLALARVSIASAQLAPFYFLASSLLASAVLILLFTRGFGFAKTVFVLSLLAFEALLLPPGLLLSNGPLAIMVLFLDLMMVIYVAWLRR